MLRVHICLSTARFSSFAPSSVSEPAKVVTHNYEERTNLGGRKQIKVKNIFIKCLVTDDVDAMAKKSLEDGQTAMMMSRASQFA